MNNFVQKIFAGGFSLGLLAPMLAILLVSVNPVVASGNDCSVSPDVGFDSTLAEVVEVDDDPWNWWGNPTPEIELEPLSEDLYVEIDLKSMHSQALRLELITGYSYTFCVEFHLDPDNPPTDDPRGDVYLFDSANWFRYQQEYDMVNSEFETPEEIMDFIPVEWRDMVVFLPFRDTHAYENKRTTSFSTALDNDKKSFVSFFGSGDDSEYFLALDSWNNTRPNDAAAVDGDMIVQVWIDVEKRLTLPKFTAYILVGLLPLSCVIVPILLHSRYHSSGNEAVEEQKELVPLLEQ